MNEQIVGQSSLFVDTGMKNSIRCTVVRGQLRTAAYSPAYFCGFRSSAQKKL